jgi:hypothetical protein
MDARDVGHGDHLDVLGGGVRHGGLHLPGDRLQRHRFVACNDDFCSLRSTITPNVTAGTTYTIVVDGYDSGESGTFTLTVTPAP